MGFYFKGMVLCLFPEGTGGNPVDAPEAVLEIVLLLKPQFKAIFVTESSVVRSIWLA